MTSTAHASNTQQQIDQLGPWFHNLHLPDGSQTAPQHPLGDFPAYKWQELSGTLPQRLDGWTALDIGCNAGYYSFELARRGAAVTAIDNSCHYLAQARWAAGQFGLDDRIEFREQQVYALAGDARRYDLVLFLGVFYHLRYPLLALDIVTSKVGSLLCLQIMSMPGEDVFVAERDPALDERNLMLEPGWPKMAFIEKTWADDPTNWWAPNHACIEAMLRTCGMRVLQRPGTEFYVCTPDSITAQRNRGCTELDAALGRNMTESANEPRVEPP